MATPKIPVNVQRFSIHIYRYRSKGLEPCFSGSTHRGIASNAVIFWRVFFDHTAAYYELAFIDRVNGHSIEDRSIRSDMAALGTCSRFPGLLTHGQSPHYHLTPTLKVSGDSSPPSAPITTSICLKLLTSKTDSGQRGGNTKNFSIDLTEFPKQSTRRMPSHPTPIDMY